MTSAEQMKTTGAIFDPHPVVMVRGRLRDASIRPSGRLSNVEKPL
jgi:hypothetical protein